MSHNNHNSIILNTENLPENIDIKNNIVETLNFPMMLIIGSIIYLHIRSHLQNKKINTVKRNQDNCSKASCMKSEMMYKEIEPMKKDIYDMKIELLSELSKTSQTMYKTVTKLDLILDRLPIIDKKLEE